MKIGRLVILCVLAALYFPLSAQEGKGITVDYNNPKEYIVSGISVEGNKYVSSNKIIDFTGMMEGMKLAVPGDDVSSIIDRLWFSTYFEDATIAIDSIVPTRDSAYFKISVVERPRVSAWTYSGIKSGERKEIEERVNLRRGGVFSDYVAKTATDIILRYYKEKGFLLAKVDVQPQVDSMIKGAIRVNFAIDKGKKVKIKKITFSGDISLKEGT